MNLKLSLTQRQFKTLIMGLESAEEWEKSLALSIETPDPMHEAAKKQLSKYRTLRLIILAQNLGLTKPIPIKRRRVVEFANPELGDEG